MACETCRLILPQTRKNDLRPCPLFWYNPRERRHFAITNEKVPRPSPEPLDHSLCEPPRGRAEREILSADTMHEGCSPRLLVCKQNPDPLHTDVGGATFSRQLAVSPSGRSDSRSRKLTTIVVSFGFNISNHSTPEFDSRSCAVPVGWLQEDHSHLALLACACRRDQQQHHDAIDRHNRRGCLYPADE